MTPGRALYEYRRPGDPAPPIPWEELAPEGREFWAEAFAYALAACPEHAALKGRLAAVEEIAFRRAGDGTADLVLLALGHHVPAAGRGQEADGGR